MPIYPLSAAWSLDEPNKPCYHDDKLLEVIARGGEVSLEQQDAEGRYRLLRKNGDDWGMFRSSYVHSHWVKSYFLVKEALPEESRKKWQEGIMRGLEHICPTLPEASIHNQPLRQAMALYIAGVCFENDDWKRTAEDYMARTVAAQNPTGFWSEHSGPVVSYNIVYPWFLGIYYYFSKDPAVLEALRRAAQFHLNLLWPDGSSVSCLDERSLYCGKVDIANPGFTTSPEGRAFLLHQLRKYSNDGKTLVDGEYAANMLLYSDDGEVAPLPTDRETGAVILGDGEALIRRHKPWQWAFSGYTCKPSANRWFQDRQNLIDVYHDRLGLVIGGGNTKLQPYWSTFTVGDCSLLRITPGEEHPDFTPDIALQWTPDKAALSAAEGDAQMVLKYGEVECRVTATVTDEGNLALTYSAPPRSSGLSERPRRRRGGARRYDGHRKESKPRRSASTRYGQSSRWSDCPPLAQRDGIFAGKQDSDG